MFTENPGDVVVHDHDLVHLPLPLLGKHADGGRAAADAHTLFRHSVDHRGMTGLHYHTGASIDDEFDRFAITEVHQRIAGDATFLLRTSGEMMNAAQRQHLRAIFARGHMADRFAVDPNRCGFRTEVAIGVDLHLDAAVAEDAFRDHGDHIDAVDLG